MVRWEQMKTITIVALVILALFALLALIVAVEIVLARKDPPPPFTNPDRVPVSFGMGEDALRYAVMGDSTAAGQGAPEDQGIAVSTAGALAVTRPVTLLNTGVSGATMEGVAADQLPAVIAFKPDLVLLSAGANDVTKLTPRREMMHVLERIVLELRRANPNVRIVITGAPEMGSVPRFLPPLSNLARARTAHVNRGFERTATRLGLGFARIAEETGPQFDRNKGLFASDRFHPNADGYHSWATVIVPELQAALADK